MDKKKSNNYFYQLYTDFILFNKEADVSCDMGFFKEKDYLKYLTCLIEVYLPIVAYPEAQLDKLIVFLNDIKDESNKDEINRLIKKVEEEKENNGEHRIDKIKIEAEKKTLNIKNILDKEIIFDSSLIGFDYYAFISLFKDETEILNNPKYLYSFKKFLIDYPELFNSKKIKKRAINILESQNLDDQYKEFIHQIKYYIENSDKLCLSRFDFSKTKSVYYMTVAFNMLFDKSNISKYDHLIDKELYECVNYIISNALYDSKSEVDNTYDILTLYKNRYIDKLPNREVALNRYNTMLNKLNLIEVKHLDKTVYDFSKRFNLFELLKGIANRDLEVNELLKNDLGLLNNLINNEEMEDNDKLYLSFGKLYNMVPFIYEQPEVLRKAEGVLNTSKEGVKLLRKIDKFVKR